MDDLVGKAELVDYLEKYDTDRTFSPQVKADMLFVVINSMRKDKLATAYIPGFVYEDASGNKYYRHGYRADGLVWRQCRTGNLVTESGPNRPLRRLS